MLRTKNVACSFVEIDRDPIYVFKCNLVDLIKCLFQESSVRFQSTLKRWQIISFRIYWIPHNSREFTESVSELRLRNCSSNTRTPLLKPSGTTHAV